MGILDGGVATRPGHRSTKSSGLTSDDAIRRGLDAADGVARGVVAVEADDGARRGIVRGDHGHGEVEVVVARAAHTTVPHPSGGGRPASTPRRYSSSVGASSTLSTRNT